MIFFVKKKVLVKKNFVKKIVPKKEFSIKNKHKFVHTSCEVKYPLSFSLIKNCTLHIDLQIDLLEHSMYGTCSKSFP